MMKNAEWVSAIISILEEFSSREFQERVWIRGDGPEVSSYEEACCRLFDDLAVNDLIDVQWQRIGLTESQRQKLIIFRDGLSQLGDDIPASPHPNQVLEHPRWFAIRDAAREALDELLNTIAH